MSKKTLRKRVKVLQHVVETLCAQMDEVLAIIYGPDELEVLMDATEKSEKHKLN